MKLRNKKTGEVGKLRESKSVEEAFFVAFNDKRKYYGSLAELNAEWEDYKPTEPLIKDEKIRKAVRTWAKVNVATELKYFEGENCLEDVFRNEIHFNQLLGLKDGETYTTEELCGEEEE